jgi:hypothetical protein
MCQTDYGAPLAVFVAAPDCSNFQAWVAFYPLFTGITLGIDGYLLCFKFHYT